MDSTTLIGLGMQTVGTVLLTLPNWSSAAVWFDTGAAMAVDRRGRIPRLVRVGLILYLVGYLPIVLGTRWGGG